MESQWKRKSAICFLVINDLSKLSIIAIQSSLDRTNAPIFIGILDEKDLANLPQSPRIQYVKLNLNIGDKTSGISAEYQDFSTDSFYQIVQYKWQLLLKVMDLGFEYVIYSDTDVYWNLDPLPVIEKVFQFRPSVEMQIQSFTDDPSEPRLCMGFVALRVSSRNRSFLRECEERHRFESSYKKKVGDDEIVTLKYAEDGFPGEIMELPQATFPVGRMLNLYRTKSNMPGLYSPEPYIFHANYVVGLTNKLILIKLFIRNYSTHDRDQKLSIALYSQLVLKRLRQLIRDLKMRALSITKSNQ